MLLRHNADELRGKHIRRIFSSLASEGIQFDIEIYNSRPDMADLAHYQQHYPLSKFEQRDIQNTVPKREIEYRTGRRLARQLLGSSPLDTHISLHKK